jgi:cell division protein FtsL
MIRFMNLNTAFLALTLLIAYGTYHVKYDAQKTLRQIKTIDRQIDQEKDKERVLAADWMLLNQPARLQRLAARHLALAPIEATQIASVVDLKARVPVLTASAEEERPVPGADRGLVKQARLEPDRQPAILRR